MMKKNEMPDNLKFWCILHDGIKSGKSLLDTLSAAKTELAGTSFEPVIAAIINDIEAGECLADAMARHSDFFSEDAICIVRGAETSGMLDKGVALGLQLHVIITIDECLDPPVKFWRLFGALMAVGKPLHSALWAAADASKDAHLLDAAKQICRGVKNERTTLYDMMRRHPELFRPEICKAVDYGERKGTLDIQALQVAEALMSGDFSELPSMPDTPPEQPAESPLEKYVNALLNEIIGRHASDVHLETQSDGERMVRLRIDGVLHQTAAPADDMFDEVVNRIMTMAAMGQDLSVPQDGRIIIRLSGQELDFRVSHVPAFSGPSIVIRLLQRVFFAPTLDTVVLLADDLQQVRRLCNLPHGIVIANGPVGSGKTTLLYAMLNEINTPERRLISIEDPVEYPIKGVTQIQIRPSTGFTYIRALISVMRQAPNVIMLGELRDFETISAAAQCAMSGHLLFSTLHTNDSVSAIQRLIDIGLEPFIVNSALAGVVSQRLVRTLCQECREPGKPPEHSIPPKAREFISQSKAEFYQPKGCDACNRTGYRGRIAVQEILVMNDTLRRLLAEGAPMAELKEAAIAAGMKTLMQNGLEIAAMGMTSIQELIRVIPPEVM